MWDHGLFPLGKRANSLKLVLPSKSAAVVKGHRGVTKAGVDLAEALVEGGKGIWEDVAQLVGENPCLETLREELAQSLTMAKAASTLGAYKTPVAEWQEFCTMYKGRAFPVDSALFLLFLQNRLNYDLERHNKIGGFLNRVYGIDLMCGMMGFEGPGRLPEVKLLIESAKRQLGRPTIKKLPCDKPLLTRLILELVPNPTNLVAQNLIDLRTAIFCLLGFVLEGRWAEVSQLCPNDFTDYGEYMVAFIEVRKTSQHREGGFVPFVDSGEVRGACTLLRLYLGMIPPGNEDIPIFRHLDFGKSKGWIWRARSVGYSRISELVKEALGRIGVVGSLYGLHSFRSGAATEVGKDCSIDSRLHDRHGGWAANSAAKDGYIAESDENRLRVPLHLCV